MIIDGETYACQGCIRGHRTRSCQHNDRPLQHIKAKGRPVSQCSHCRAERKNRSAHVKCHCGKGAAEGGTDCGCSSGQKCRCATKKSAKQAPTGLDDAVMPELSLTPTTTTSNNDFGNTSMMLGSPPEKLATTMDLGLVWPDSTMTTAATTTEDLSYPSLDDMMAQFGDTSSWLHDDQLDATTITASTTEAAAFGDSGGNGLDSLAMTGPSIEDGNNSNNILKPSLPNHQLEAADLSGFSNVSRDWPDVEDQAAREFFLAMMGKDNPVSFDTTADVGSDATAFGLGDNGNQSGINLSFGGQAAPALPLQAAFVKGDASECKSKTERGCGPCCG